jgi:hypothetical protein
VRFRIPFSSLGGYGSYTNNDSEWELAVIRFDVDEIDEYELDYSTGITDDVIGHLTEEEVQKYLLKIKKLKRSKELTN